MRWIGAVMLAGVAGGVAAGPLVPVMDFARKAEYESAKISPNGDYLAVATPVGGQTALGVIDLKNRKLSGALRFSRGEHVANYWWVSPTRVVAAIANRGGPLDQPRMTGELYAMNADGSGKAYLFGYRGGQQVGTHISGPKQERAWAFVEDALPHEPDYALISIWPWHRGKEMAYPLIERINVLNGSRTRVTVVPAYAPVNTAADRSGTLRLAVGLDAQGRHRLLAPDATQTSGWRDVALPGGEAEDVTLHRATPDGKSVFLTTSEPSGRACLREYRVETGEFTSRACSDAGEAGFPVFSFNDDALLGVRHEGGRPELDLLAPGHPDAKLLLQLMKTFGAQRVSVTSRTLDGQSIVIRVDSDLNPGDFFLVNRQTRKAEYLVSRRAWIDPATMTPSAPVSYTTRDGAVVHGYLTAPGGRQARKAPLVLLPHGGPHGVRDWWEWSSWAQLLASRGYAVLQVNYRGSAGYGLRHEHAGHRKWGTLMQDDLTDAAKWAVAEGIADPARLCIFGASYGGYAALMSAVREPDLYRCAVGFAGVYDLPAQADDSDIADHHLGRVYLKRVLGDEALMREQSPVTHIAALKAAVLIAHGTSDRRVPFSQARILRKALEKHGKTYEWIEFAGEEHGFYDDKNHEAFLNKLLDFLDRHIGERRGEAAAKASG